MFVLNLHLYIYIYIYVFKNKDCFKFECCCYFCDFFLPTIHINQQILQTITGENTLFNRFFLNEFV